MIVVFVVDTSPSMGNPLLSQRNPTQDPTKKNTKSNSCNNNMSRLDLAKMAVESITKALDKRIQDNNQRVHLEAMIMNTAAANTNGGSTTNNSSNPKTVTYFHNLGFGYHTPDQFLLLSTGLQKHTSKESLYEACGAGGRLLVGFNNTSYHGGDSLGDQLSSFMNNNNNNMSQQSMLQQFASIFNPSNNHDSFQKELKYLKATTWTQQQQTPTTNNTDDPTITSTNSRITTPFPEDGGGAHGLNAALSAGLQLLSRYRLQHRHTENFGMGRLPTCALFYPTIVSDPLLSLSSNNTITNDNYTSNNNNNNNNNTADTGNSNTSFQHAVHALQPACLVLLTDGECLSKPSSEGGGMLKLQFGNMPLREFYNEPFRWDQRIFCLGVGTSSENIHPSLRAFCEVTGGCHAGLQSVSELPFITDLLLKAISPSIPREFPLPNPLRLSTLPPPPPIITSLHTHRPTSGIFINGGPVCSFQQLEHTGEANPVHRAMLLYTPHVSDVIVANTNQTNINTNNSILHPPPIWFIPESHFPSKKLDVLPPRTAQPMLSYSKQYMVLGGNTFDPLHIMKLLHRLDTLLMSNKLLIHNHQNPIPGSNTTPPSVKLLQRDVYICQWLGQQQDSISPTIPTGQHHFPVCVRGAGRKSITSDGEENVLFVGILHLPGKFASPNDSGSNVPSSLTLLPPDPHILLPLLVKATEVTHRALKKTIEHKEANTPSKTVAIQSNNASLSVTNRTIQLDDNWKSEFRAYLFRVPPYYQHTLRRALRPILPPCAHSLLSSDSMDIIMSLCFSRICSQKIRSGEQYAREYNERLDRREDDYKKGRHELDSIDMNTNNHMTVGYGQYDTRVEPSSYLAQLRNMPPPGKSDCKSNSNNFDDMTSVPVSLGNLPHQCLLAYYESRRRWIFGGQGLTTRGLFVEGVNNDGTDCHYYDNNQNVMDTPLITLCGVGASIVNKTKISKMGDFKERLFWSRQPVVGYGCNDSTGSAVTTAPDGSPVWSVDDDALPLSFFDYKTGEFIDSAQNRLRSKLAINLGNPFKDKRGNSLVPDNFKDQRPKSLQKSLIEDECSSLTPPGSPPHDAFSPSVEGEGEAIFVGKPPSPSRRHAFIDEMGNTAKKHFLPDSFGENPESKRMKIDHSQDGSNADQSTPKAPVTLKRIENNKPKVKPPPPPPRPPSMQQKPPPPPAPPKQLKKKTIKTDNSQQQDQQQVQKQVPEQQQPIQPPPMSSLPKQPQPQQQQPNQQNTLDLQNPDTKPNVNLPPGWMSVWSKSKQRWYFFDQKSNKSIWEWPERNPT